jgi:hypothetical protein
MKIRSAVDSRTDRIEILILRADSFEDNQLLLALYNSVTGNEQSLITFEDGSVSCEYTVGGRDE